MVNFGPPETNAFLMNGEKINQSKGSRIIIKVTDAAGNGKTGSQCHHSYL